MEPIRTLFTTELQAEPVLPESLRAQYGGDLRFPPVPPGRPYVFANFVSTLDGVVSFNIPGQSEGAQINGTNEGDRFIMGLLRASADVILVGAGTVEVVSPGSLWLPESVHPAAGDLYRHYRQDVLRKPERPLVVVVTGTGDLDLLRAVFQDPVSNVLIITTEQGKAKLARGGSQSLDRINVRALPVPDGRIPASAILALLSEEFDARLVLHEGGPTLFGDLLAARLVDELFLTIAPQIAGRIVAHSRPALVSNVEFRPGNAPWLKLLTAKKSGDHLYLRYQIRP